MKNKRHLKSSSRRLTNQGFTLIEVLLALAVIAISLTALLKATGANITSTQRLKEKTISHWIAMQGINMVQLGLIKISASEDTTQMTQLFGQRWYWRAKLTSTAFPKVKQINISMSPYPAGPFQQTTIGYEYQP